MYWLAFTTGLLGSLHCLGMCGPLALSLPGDTTHKAQYVFQRVQYNLGRILAYAMLGAVMGIPGQWIKPAGWQQALSIFAGSLLLVTLFTVALKSKFNFIDKFHAKVAKAIGKTMQKTGKAQWITIGVLNGFLPCGLVYVALAGALASGSISHGIVYMVLFGLGTFPLMLVVSISGSFASFSFRNKIKRVIPTATFVVGVLLILRGLNLGIPYISPQVKESQSNTTEQKNTTMECCKTKSDTNMAK
jgi:uncharacterized protein